MPGKRFERLSSILFVITDDVGVDRLRVFGYRGATHSSAPATTKPSMPSPVAANEEKILSNAKINPPTVAGLTDTTIQ